MEFPEDENNLYREMDVDVDGFPLVGPSNFTLGVRTRGRLRDIEPDEHGHVRPQPVSARKGGMSVAPRTPMNLSELHRPPGLGGEGTYPVWRITKRDLNPETLIYQETTSKHGRIAPAKEISLQEYEEALAETREAWMRVVG